MGDMSDQRVRMEAVVEGMKENLEEQRRRIEKLEESNALLTNWNNKLELEVERLETVRKLARERVSGQVDSLAQDRDDVAKSCCVKHQGKENTSKKGKSKKKCERVEIGMEAVKRSVGYLESHTNTSNSASALLNCGDPDSSHGSQMNV